MENKKNLTPLICVMLSCLLMMGCDEHEIKKGPLPDKEALVEFFNTHTNDNLQMATLNASTGGSVHGDQGTVLQFGADAFLTHEGDVVTGEVDIEFLEIYDRADMLFTRKPTHGKMSNGDVGMLISGGEFYVNASKNGVGLKLAGGFTLIAPTAKTGGVDEDMRQFQGEVECEGEDCDVVWAENQDRGIEMGEFQGPGGVYGAYYCFIKQFGWTNIDRWFSDPRDKTTIFVTVPEGFDNSNCAVFIAYEGEPTALGRFDRFDELSGKFTEHYGLIPIGLKVHIILVSIIEEEIHYAIKSATISENHEEVFEAVESISEEELANIINELP